MSQKTVAVYGSNGFIGSVLIGKLLDKGYKVIGLDNCYKKIDGILYYFNHPNFKFQFCDITKEEQVKKSFENQIDCIILLSGIVGLDACDFNISLATEVNDKGWELVCKNKPQLTKLVAASTGSVYGKIKDEVCSENTQLNPLSHYGITKLAGENHVLNYGGTAFRFATAAGVSPQMRLNLLPNYLAYEAVHKKYISVFQPDVMRTFIDIRDFCDSLIFGIEHIEKLSYKVYNIGDKKNNWSKRKMVEFLQERTGCKVDWNDSRFDNDFRDYEVDYTRINNEGWQCQYDISNTLSHLLQTVKHLKIDNPYV